MIPPDEALALLREGNLRYRAGRRDRDARVDPRSRAARIASPHPVAVLLGCSDSRIQPETLFQQCSGDLFVTRVAGGVAGPSQIGSIEFGIDAFGIRLVVVLGHSGCGAVSAALERDRPASEHLEPILHRIRAALPPGPRCGLDEAVRANVRASCAALAGQSALLRDAIGSGRIRVVGAHYCLQSGAVEFLDDDAARAAT